MRSCRPRRVDETLGTGADDYITKPFSMHESLARVKAPLRRVDMDGRPDDRPSRLEAGELVLDVAA